MKGSASIKPPTSAISKITENTPNGVCIRKNSARSGRSPTADISGHNSASFNCIKKTPANTVVSISTPSDLNSVPRNSSRCSHKVISAPFSAVSSGATASEPRAATGRVDGTGGYAACAGAALGAVSGVFAAAASDASPASSKPSS